MKFVVDRIENDIAVLENIKNKEIINISLKLLPKNLKEGDVLKFNNNKYFLDNNEKQARLNRIREKMKMLKEDKQ